MDIKVFNTAGNNVCLQMQNIPIPKIDKLGPMRKLHTNKKYMATRIRRVELKNFMKFGSQVFEFSPTNFITGTVSTGKSTIVMAIFLALGQDDILDCYGHRLEDSIKLGANIAVIKLTVATPYKSSLREIYGSKMQICRKLQIEDGRMLPTVWKLKSLREDPALGNASKTVSVEYMTSTVFPQLGIKNWCHEGIPFLVTADSLEVNGKKSCCKWFDEFDQLLAKKMEVEFREKAYLKTELEKLKKALEELNQQQNNDNSDGDCDCDCGGSEEIENMSEKLKLQVQIKRGALKTVTDKIQLGRIDCASEFETYYKRCATAMRVYGECIIDTERGVINFAVDEFPFPSNVDSIKRQYVISSLRSKEISLYIMILTFWNMFDVSPIYIIESTLENAGLRKFFRSNAFNAMVEGKENDQFIISGYAF